MTMTRHHVLDDARRAVEPVLRRRVGTLPTRLRQRAIHHFGWDDPDSGTGKAVRPALVLATARAVGSADDTALTVAAAVELVHNFTLIHDDVHDQDAERHGRPALWTVYGTTEALLVGNALCALGLETLAGLKGVDRLARCVSDLCEGQSMDVEFEQRSDVSLDECVEMSAGKTGVLLGCACALTALNAGAEDDVVRAFDDFGVEIGIAFQLANDLLGIWGDERATGKPTCSDLARLKKTLPIIRALRSGTDAGAELAGLYAQGAALDEPQTRRAKALVARTGAREWAEAEIHRRVDLALSYVEKTGSPEITSLAKLAFVYYRSLSSADS
ncbi:polyprenyl synthetase family protein [Lentzea sp. PSKA42]|uniref:Polyprenyl synthetase family protein n=1 Tax=Lentzea indica TaxID=2604800 RepID=A0ABX1FHD8_9PSEU|nr:polyprenyl synthetase family protein [Lentzea indica]NKE58307.1 polyprenyl synthetase family protein [Lentzea indica]